MSNLIDLQEYKNRKNDTQALRERLYTDLAEEIDQYSPTALEAVESSDYTILDIVNESLETIDYKYDHTTGEFNYNESNYQDVLDQLLAVHGQLVRTS